MTSYDAIVIGAGLNGLVAATMLAQHGKKVCLLEQAPGLGGLAAPDANGRPRMAHLLYNLSPLVRKELKMGAHSWPFQTQSLPTVALDSDGRHVVVRGSLVSFADKSQHPDAQSYDQLIRRLKTYGALLRQLAEDAPPGFDGPLTSTASIKRLWRFAKLGVSVKRLPKAELRRFLQILLSNAYDLILDDLPDGPLAGLLAADAVRGAAAGPRSPGTVFNLIYRLGHGGDVQVPVEGFDAVINAFATAAETAGCEIRTNTAVSRILVHDDQTTGIKTQSGDTLTAPLVLTSSGALNAARMAGPDHFDIEALRRLRNFRAKGTAAKINLTLSDTSDIPGLPDNLRSARMVFAPTADYVEKAFNPSKYREMSTAPVIELVMPDPRFLSIIVQYAPVDLMGGWTDAAKDKLLNTTLTALSKVIPNLPGLMTSAEVITPEQIESETGAPGGHWHHGEMAIDQVLSLRPGNGMGRYALGPKGLYLCGASAHPGGDLMGLAGRNAALKALEDTA